MMLGGQFASIPLPFDNCVVPDGINGPVAIFITSDGQPLINNVRDRATTQLVAGPTMAFIDTKPQMLGQLARQNSAAAPQSTSTRTISPSEASSIISGASSTAASPAATTASGSSAGDSSTAPAPSPTPGSASAPAVAGTPNTFTGKSSDGAITVNGWTGL